MGKGPIELKFAPPPPTSEPATPPPSLETPVSTDPCPVELNGDGDWVATCDFDGDSYTDTLVFREAGPMDSAHNLLVTYGNPNPNKIHEIVYIWPPTLGATGIWRVSSVTITRDGSGTQFNVVSSPGSGETATDVYTQDISFNPHNPKSVEAAQERLRQLQE